MNSLYSNTIMEPSPLNVVYQGRPISVIPGIAENNDELYYRLMHSLVSGDNPVGVGISDTNRIHGMQPSQNRGYLPNLANTMIMRKVIQETIFRPAIIKNIQKYVDADDATVLRAIGRNNTDAVVAQHLSQLPRKTYRGAGDDRIQNRVHTITNFLTRIPHVPIVNYLDYGTGDGRIAAAVADALSVPPGEDPNTQPGRRVFAQGVDVFPMQRPIPTRVVRDGENLPEEWTNRFQLITAFVVLHHVRNQEHILRELYRVLAPGGVLILREHDYRDMTPSAILRQQKRHMNDPQGIVLDIDPMEEILGERPHTIGGDPFRHFLDAIHISSMALAGEDTRNTDCAGCGHSTSKEPAFWALYRARMEWHNMLQQAGFSHMCTVSQGFSSVSSQMENRIRTCNNVALKPQQGLSTSDTVDPTGGDEKETPEGENDGCNGWLSRNPQRIYEAVYMKPVPLNLVPTTPMILEYKMRRELVVDTFFPRIGGRTGEAPQVRIGINYDEEILAYMTPWHAAQQTSRLILDLMSQEYGQLITPRATQENPNPTPYKRTPNFNLFDGTGGAGGNMIAFLSNRNITTLNVYERVPKFFNYIVNNAQLYTKQRARPLDNSRTALTFSHDISNNQGRSTVQNVYLYNRELPLRDLTAEIRGTGSRGRTQMTDSVLFLDVPWVSEGCGYKLRGYMYGGEYLEAVAERVLRAGAYMVVFKLPPDYQLEMKHIVENLGKETLYVVYRRFLRPVNRHVNTQPESNINVVTRNRPVVSQPVPAQQTTVDTVVQGGNPALELIRYRLMDHLRTRFRELVPNARKDDYYKWVYERVRTYGTCGNTNTVCTFDPIIPATPTFVPSTMITMEPFWPDVTFTQLSEIIREQYPQLVPQLQQTFFLDEQSVIALRRAVANETALRQQDQVQQIMIELDTLARDLYQLYTQASSTEGIAATVIIQGQRTGRQSRTGTRPTDNTGGNVSLVITPNQILRNVLTNIDNELGSTGKYPSCSANTQSFACVTLLGSKMNSLRERYVGNAFEQNLAAMLLRYSIMMEPTREMSFSGVNLHAAIPPALFRMLGERLGVTTEAFASPLNATLRFYMSAFPDTDAPFGSIGSFFTYDYRYGGLPTGLNQGITTSSNVQNGPSGSFEANPPFTEDMITEMMVHMESLLQQADDAGTPLSFFIVVPNWQSPPVNAIKESRWKRFETIIPATQHRFIGGQQHLQDTAFTATFDTYIAVIQSQAGTTRYPVPTGFGSHIATSFT